MSMAPSIETHLGRSGIDFNLIPHPHSSNSLQTARLAHVAANQVAKAVMTHDGETYRLCLIPSTHKLVLSWLNEHMLTGSLRSRPRRRSEPVPDLTHMTSDQPPHRTLKGR